ncbi:MAG: glycerate kinase, partial [Chloroflexi bacterium]|nr:glycerate kinase [Chloroflexota bacterium]
MAGPRRAPRVLVAPQEFKGSLDAGEAARAIAAGVRAAWPDAEVIERPMSDGGPGTASLVAAAAGGTLLHARVRGALGDPVDAAYAWLERPAEPPMALVESATAVGLLLTPPERRDPALASTEGVGELVLDAARRGARRIVIGCGGTGTSDGGSGLARALGLRLLDAAVLEFPPGAIHLARLHRIERSAEPPLRGIEVIAAVDVQNTLTGPAGAVAVYGRQKGVPDWQAPALDAALARWAEVVRRDLGREIEHAPGTGAGGGLPAGLLAAVS